jgi:hypothetical protein
MLRGRHVHVPIVPGQSNRLRLMSFPEGYRHLAYLQTGIGYSVGPDMPGVTGPEVESLYVKGAQWLKGASIEVIDGKTQRLAAWPLSLRPVSWARTARYGLSWCSPRSRTKIMKRRQ